LKTGKSLLRQQQIIVSSVLGSISLAVLVFTLGSAKAFSHEELGLSPHVFYAILVTMIGGISATCIMAAFSMSGEAGGLEDYPRLGRFGEACLGVGLLGTLAVLPLLVLPFTLLGAAALAALETVLVSAFLLSRL
jgi:hypothetical protein